MGVQTVLWNLLCLCLHCLKSSFYYTSLNPQILQMDCIVRTSRFRTFFHVCGKTGQKKKNNMATKIRLKKRKGKKPTKQEIQGEEKYLWCWILCSKVLATKSPCYIKINVCLAYPSFCPLEQTGLNHRFLQCMNYFSGIGRTFSAVYSVFEATWISANKSLLRSLRELLAWRNRGTFQKCLSQYRA